MSSEHADMTYKTTRSPSSYLGYRRQGQLILPAPNKDIGLTAQRPEVQLMLRGTIDAVQAFLYLVEFYPVYVSCEGWIRPGMIEVATGKPALIHVLDRLLNDAQFAAILSPIISYIPLDRINITRGDIKRCVLTVVWVIYNLKGLTAGEVKTRVEELLKDHRPFSIFKGRNYERLARHPKHPDAREIADPMVAVAGTAVYACLLELRLTAERQAMAFTKDAFEDIQAAARPLRGLPSPSADSGV
ncbi:hypothetical protein K438DRAFT_2003393 [Mycena galopus ATCC 62051]|nr:hypothetical protein K438DRAFT_2003393 [Mycena galopus ATCC 62051]